MAINPKGRDWSQRVNWDSLGKAYAGIAIAWTIILYVGVAWLIRNRSLPFIKIRNVPIAVASVTFLHLYLVKILLAYTTNGHFTCSAEFWIMSLYLPFGIALFQANLVQLRTVSDQQHKLLSSADSMSTTTSVQALRSPRGLWNHWKALSEVKKSYVYIGLGMLVQLIITAVLYATSPELQGDWSSYGDISHAKGQLLCRKSTRWIPSALWQLIWSWAYGPYILFKIRNIHDVHYWRLGTWLSVVSGLPGTPFWLAALYSRAFRPANRWWVPPMWLAPGIIVMQVVTVFFPIYEAYRSRAQMRTTMSLIKHWEEKRAERSDSRLVSAGTSKHSQEASTRSKDIYKMASFEKALSINPLPLLHFAATKDFTAENIVFLMRVKDWRQAWKTAARQSDSEEVTDDARTRLFRMAVEIYTICVNGGTSDFPINIDGQTRAKLDALFEPAVPEEKKRQSKRSSADPFDAMIELEQTSPNQADFNRVVLRRNNSGDSGQILWDDKGPSCTAISLPSGTNTPGDASEDDERSPTFAPHPVTAPLGSARAKIREGFNVDVFDAAEASVKYLVLTNTWRKFVKAGEESLLKEIGLNTA